MTHECSCGAQWTGGSRCHCSTCHHTYSGLTAFDAHVAARTGTRDDAHRTCPDPESIGLEARDTRHGVIYGHPMTDEDRARINAAFNQEANA